MSGLRCWVGAVVRLSSPRFPENAGAIGTVVGRSWTRGHDWHVEFTRPLRWTTYAESMPPHEGDVHDWRLTPITPPPGAETTEDTAPCEVESTAA